MKFIKKAFTKYDEHGSVSYNMYIIFAIIISLAGSIAIAAANILFSFEIRDIDSNIRTLGDAFWTVWMAMSTIGFGDHYPITLGGRIIVGGMFIVGGLLIGLNVAIAGFWLSMRINKDSRNGDLKLKLDATLHKLDRIENHIGIESMSKFGEDAHGIDIVFDHYSDTKDNIERIVTFGQDDTGHYIVAINERIIDVDKVTLRWYTFNRESEAIRFYQKSSAVFHSNRTLK